MTAETIFKQDYEKHLQHLKLQGLQPKTIDAYSRSIRYIGKYFDYEIRNLSEQQLTDYFIGRIDTHSWSAVKLDLYGLYSGLDGLCRCFIFTHKQGDYELPRSTTFTQVKTQITRFIEKNNHRCKS